MQVTELKAEIANIIHVKPEEVTDHLRPNDVAGWDSMAQLQIIALLEEFADGELSEDDVAQLRSIHDILTFAQIRGIIG